jgi:hypothetical protein
MSRAIGWVLSIVLIGGAGAVEARERNLEELPGDVLSLATVWTEPLKSVARETRHFDPVSGLWFGLVEGSVKSLERTANFFLPRNDEPPAEPGKLLRYSF